MFPLEFIEILLDLDFMEILTEGSIEKVRNKVKQIYWIIIVANALNYS
jgi:hypothetical protein